MRGEHDSAGSQIVVDLIVDDEIVVGLAGVVADEDAAGVVLGDVVGDGGVGDSHDVDAFTAVELFAGLEVGDAGAGLSHDACVVAANAIAFEGNVGGVDEKGAFEFRVLEGEAGDDDVAEAGIVEAINKNAVGETGGVDDGAEGTCTDQRQRFSDDYGFLVGTGGHDDGATGWCGSDCVRN